MVESIHPETLPLAPPRDIRELVGQLFVCGFEGKTLPQGLQEALEKGHCGGIILFARNIATPAELVSLNTSIAETNKAIPPWIGVDQEGGRVRRLRAPFTELPPAAVLGIEDSTDIARQYGQILGEEAAAAGFNWVFAPILDVHTNPHNPVIGDRSLAQQPEQVARLAMAKADGLIDAGVMPCGKHFPGHGDTDKDSHLTLPTVSHPRERLESIEWLPFRAAVQAGLPAIMTAHVLFPTLDSVYPATLSVRILRDILRDAWGYDGLVVSDDLEMKGVAEHYPIEEIVVRGLLAGIDVFLLCRVWEALGPATEAVLAALRDGRISEERLLASWRRIMRAKARFAGFSHRCSSETIDSYLAEQHEHRAQAAHLQSRWVGASRQV